MEPTSEGLADALAREMEKCVELRVGRRDGTRVKVRASVKSRMTHENRYSFLGYFHCFPTQLMQKVSYIYTI